MKEEQEKQEALHKKVESIMGPTYDTDGKTGRDDTTASSSTEVISSRSVLTKTEQPNEQIDPTLDQAVDDIVAKEGDELLKAEDEKIAEAFGSKPPQTLSQKIKTGIKNWWHNKKLRNRTFAGMFAVLTLLLIVPNSRYFILNTLGVRTSASVVVVDQSTQQPLRSVLVSINGVTSETDDTGTAKLDKLKLGKNNLSIKKRAFATASKTVTLGWGSNPLGNIGIEPVGLQYTFVVKDFLSGKPIEKAEAIAGPASAFSDHQGKIVLTIDKEDVETVTEATILADTYRSEKEILDDKQQEKTILMVPSHKHAFISKRSGKYDLYKIDLDGKNQKLVLAGTGYEKEDISLVPHPSANVVAYVSTRNNVRNADGFLLSTLSVVNLDDDEVPPEAISRSERIQVIGWWENRVIYVQITEGQSAANDRRHRLMSYDYVTRDNKELASANYFNDVMLANGVVYYAPAPGKNTAVGLFSVKPDGSEYKMIVSDETWNMYRTGYNTMTFSVGNQWYDYTLGASSVTVAEGAPTNQKTRIYMNGPNNKQSLWVDQRDGKGVLLAYNVESGQDKILHSASGLDYPVSWLSNSVVIYRIHTDEETADFAISIDGGEPRKIADVTNTESVEAWYYYY